MKGRDASEQDNVLQYINQDWSKCIKRTYKNYCGCAGGGGVGVNSLAYRKFFRAQKTVYWLFKLALYSCCSMVQYVPVKSSHTCKKDKEGKKGTLS